MPARFALALRWLRVHGDEVFAAVFTVTWLSGLVSGGIPDGDRDLAAFAACGLLITVPLAWRTRCPQAATIAVPTAGFVQSVLLSGDLPIGFVVAALLVGYSLGAHGTGRWAAYTGGYAIVVITVTNVPHNDAGPAGLVLTPFIFGVVPWGVGRLVARLRDERMALHAMALRLEREQQEIARSSVLEERARIARELHDIVAHSITVMVVQAGAAEQFVAAESPARAPLHAIRTTGQEALVEMRRLLGVLRTDPSGPSALVPQPGLDNLDGLIEAARRTGLDVDVDIQGESVPLPAGIDVAAFRLVQESLSNVRKHARARSVGVLLRFDTQRLTIDVSDDGIGARDLAVDSALTAGHGLIGMRERVTVYGGRIECGPRAGGGWQVRAELPLAT